MENEIMETAHNLSKRFQLDYGEALESEINRLEYEISRFPEIEEQYPARWVAIKLLEEDRDIQIKLLAIQGGPVLLERFKQSIAILRELQGEDLDVLFADRRYQWINQLVHNSVYHPTSASNSLSDRIDGVLIHRHVGIPIFMFVMWVVFILTATVSAPYVDWIDYLISGPITNWVGALLSAIGLGDTWVNSLFVDGIIAGVGGVLVFIPVLTFLYLALAILEDTGYMARGAFVMDRVMSKIGLHGNSFLPMLVGFGCTVPAFYATRSLENVPAFYATRSLENEKDRILTGLLVPFMSCGARLPVFVLFAAVFFPEHAGTVVFGMYLLGILIALLFGFILRKTVFKGEEQSAMIIELPPYRMPNPKSVWIYLQQRVGSFIKNASTIILATSVIIWFLMATPVIRGRAFAQVETENSLFAALNRVTAPLLEPLGFADWQTSSALLTGFVAKEVIVSTMAQVYDVEEIDGAGEEATFVESLGEILTSFYGATRDTLKSLPLILGINLFEEEVDPEPAALTAAMRSGFDTTSGGHAALAALGFMVFVLIYTPCMVAVSAERQELGMKWTWVSIFGQLLLAWLMAFLVFQGGQLLGFG
jgi:ferrous iron transport protein B